MPTRPSHWFIVIGVGCLAVLFILAGLLRPVGDLARRFTLPVVRFVAQTSKGQFHQKDVQVLESRLTRLAIDYARLQALEEENKTLRLQAKFLTTSGYDSVGARIISRDLRHERALLLIDRGLEDRLEVGQAVIVQDGIFIGKIYSLKEQVATVELLTDPQSRVAATLAGEKRVMGVVEGRGNGTAKLAYIPSSEKIQVDQILLTANLEDKVPPNLPLGIVNAVEGQPTDPFLSASIEPFARLDQIFFVSVLRPAVLKPK